MPIDRLGRRVLTIRIPPNRYCPLIPSQTALRPGREWARRLAAKLLGLPYSQESARAPEEIHSLGSLCPCGVRPGEGLKGPGAKAAG